MIAPQEHYVAPFDGAQEFDEALDVRGARSYRPSISGWVGISLVTFWLVAALLGPLIAPYGENALPFPDAYSEYQSPQQGAVLGTDVLDRDVFSRLLYGASRTIGISLAATLLAYFIGVIAGIAAAVSSPTVDTIITRINDIFLSLPTIMLGLVAVAALGSSIPVLIGTAGFVYASVVFRLSRATAKEVAVSDFVEGAFARGEKLSWIISREIWPNIRMPLITDFGLRMIYVTLFISSLSFLGLGVQPPQADWGSMVRENLGALQYGDTPVAVLAPAFAIATLTIGINLIVDDISASDGGKLSGRM